MIDFPCTKCGVCCKSIGGVPAFKELDRGDGTCKHLNLLTNECSIYEERPPLCDIRAAYDSLFSQNMSVQEFYILNAEACNQLQTVHGIDRMFRINTHQLFTNS